MAISIERAKRSDLGSVVELQTQAVNWIAAKGLDQWQPSATGSRHTPDLLRANIGRSIATGTCYVAVDGTEIVGTITIDRFADPEFWTEADHPDDALYIHRMVVRRDRAGEGIGSAMLEYARELASKKGKRWLRLDAWRTNEALHSYYRSVGFEHVRTLNYPHRGSGALFQQEANL